MPRYPRPLGSTGIYHVMIRGINKMDIFRSPNDKAKFLGALSSMKSEGEYTLYGYCIMDNHAHLLIKEEIDPINRTMKRLCVSYSYYFNKKYDRVGHLFQDRFRSERIENDNSLLNCLRYIHNNPVKASMVTNPSDYNWSSYNIYIGKDNNAAQIISSRFVLDLISENKSNVISKFRDFSRLDCEEEFIDLEEAEDDIKIDPLVVIQDVIRKYNYKLEDLLKCKDKEMRSLIIREIKDNTKLSIRQMAEMTGFSKDMIARALK